MLPVTGRFMPLSPQGSQMLPVQLSPNMVRLDLDAVDLFPVFVASPRTGIYLTLLSPISYEAAESHDCAIGSPATSLSITDHTANLQLLTPPLIPFPDTILVQADPALLLRHIRIFSRHRSRFPWSTRCRFLSRKGPFDASTEPAATRDHPLISAGWAGCPYRMTSYRDDDHSCVVSLFGVHVHHPRFLEWVGAPESARLLCHPPAEWLQVMNR